MAMAMAILYGKHFYDSCYFLSAEISFVVPFGRNLFLIKRKNIRTQSYNVKNDMTLLLLHKDELRVINMLYNTLLNITSVAKLLAFANAN